MGLGYIATGVCAVAVFALVTFLDWKKRPETVGVAAFLLLTWFVCALASVVGTPPESMFWGQVMDGFLSVFLLGSFMFDRPKWKIRMAILLMIQGFLHFSYQATFDRVALSDGIVLGLNLLYLAQLACIAEPGVSDAVKAYRERGARLGFDHRGARPN